jgi:integrase
MAVLKKRGGVFGIDFRFAGKRFRQSLKTDNERAAKNALGRADEILRRLELGQLDLPPGADVATFILSDGRVEEKKKAAEIFQVGALLDEYLRTLTPDCLESTTEHCVNVHIRHFRRVFGEKQALNSLDLQHYIDTRALDPGLRGKTLSATTIKKELGTLGMVWTWALAKGFVQEPLARKALRFPKTADKPPFQTMEEVQRKIAVGGLTELEIAELWDSVFLTLPETDEFLRHVEKTALHRCLYPMIVFAAHTGARRSEIRRSRIEDLEFGVKRIFIRERKRVRGRHTLRSVPMTPSLELALRDWLKEHPGGRYTFGLGPDVLKSTKDRHEPIAITDDEAGHHFEQIVLGTKWENLRGWHLFRHSFCSNCAAKGIDQRMINAWVGHQTEEMVRRYRHLFPNQEREAIENVFG